MARLETLTKRAALAALLTVTALQLALHPDVTSLLRVIGVAAFGAGWAAARKGGQRALLVWALVAPLAPALLLVAAGRQGPIVEIVWMAGLTGSLATTVSTTRWAGPDVWRVLLGGWALVLSVSWPVLLLREAGFDTESLRNGATVNSWAMLTAPQVMAWTLYAVQVQLTGLLWLDWLAARFSADPDRIPRPLHGLWIGVTLASVVAILQGIVDLRILNVEFWTGEGRASGTMLDANAFGTAAALAGPIGYLALRGVQRSPAAAAVAVLAVNWTGVWMSSSRTAFLCAIAGAAGLAIGLLRAREDRPVRRHPLLLAAAAAAALVVIVFAGAVGPLERLSGIALTRESVLSLWNRGGYGTVAVEMAREYPLTGVGVGGYRYMSPDYWRAMADMQMALDNAQNWWRHQAAELGVLGGAFVMLWSLVVAWHVLGGRARPTATLSAWTVRALLAGIGAASLVGVPTQNPIVLLAFFALVAWLAALVTAPRPVLAVPPEVIRAGWAAAPVLALAYVSGHALLAAGPLEVAERAKRFRHQFVEGAYAPEALPDGGEFRWTDDESRFVLPARTRWLLVRVWAHHPDIAQRPVEVGFASSCGTLLSRELTSTAPVAFSVVLPPDLEVLDGTISVSRTWSPADQGAADDRQLGVAVQTEFVSDYDIIVTRDYRIDWRECPDPR